MTTGVLLAAAVYARQSHGKERSIGEQVSEGHRDCGDQGWPVAGVYKDSTSASRFARGTRPDWDRLLDDLERDARGWGVLWMWESSRGDRTPQSWLAMLASCRAHRVLIRVGSHERTYDMTVPRDWRTLADEGIDAAYESEKTSLRVRRDLKSNAAKGRPHGPVLFGYERVYDSRTRELLEQRPVPAQAGMVRDVFARFAAGEPISAIVEGLNARGVPSATGGRWGRASVRQMLSNPAYIGKRRTGARSGPGEIAGDAIWPAIVDEATFYAAGERLARQARDGIRPGKLRWLLSYLARCAECGGHLSAFRAYYGCADHGHVYIRRDWLDQYVTEHILVWLEVHGREMLTPPSQDAEAATARTEAAGLRQRHGELAAQAAAGDISGTLLAAAEKQLLAGIAAAEARERAATVPPFLRELTADPAFVREVWETSELAAKREVIAALMTITVHRSPRRGRLTEFDPERVTIEWTGTG